MSRCLLITRPEHDEVNCYLCKWSEKVIDEAEKKGLDVIDLRRRKANKRRFIGTLKKVNPGLVFMNGHGDAVSVWGHNDEVILGDDDVKDIDASIIFARSCDSARVFGEAAVVQKVKAFLGYRRSFWLAIDPEKASNPLDDETAKLFLEPSNYVVIALLKGHTASLANQKAKEKFLENIRKLMASNPSSEDRDIIKALYWNMINQVCLGDKDAVF